MKKELTRKGKEQTVEQPIVAYKGFDRNMQCRGFQYEVGKTYKHEGRVMVCDAGFHSCEYPLDVLSYYQPSNSRFAVVHASGQISREKADGDTKIASSSISIKAEISPDYLVDYAAGWLLSHAGVDSYKKDYSDKNVLYFDGGVLTVAGSSNNQSRSVAANTYSDKSTINNGKESLAVSTKFRTAAINMGSESVAAATGRYALASSTGGYSITAVTNFGAAATNKGNCSASVSTGSCSAASNRGGYSVAVSIGNSSIATNTGESSVAVSAGWRSLATSTGNQSTAVSTNNYSAAEVTGTDSVAVSLGISGRARAPAGGAIVLCYRRLMGEVLHIRASKVGENGIKPDTWYTLNERGEFVEDCGDE